MLTDRQRATYRFIRDYHEKNGYAPKLGEIAQGIGIQSKGVVHRYTRAIAKEGLIELDVGKHRGIHLVDGHAHHERSNLTLPLVGKIAAGSPIEAISDHDSIDLAEFLTGPDRFALRVQGDSMIDAGILDGDIVVVEKRDYADDGEIVVALIDNEEATLKRLKKNRDDHVTLVPANQTMRPIRYPGKRIKIEGVIIGQLRTFGTGSIRSVRRP